MVMPDRLFENWATELLMATYILKHLFARHFGGVNVGLCVYDFRSVLNASISFAIMCYIYMLYVRTETV